MKRILLLSISILLLSYTAKAQLLADFETVVPIIKAFSPNGDYAPALAENPWVDDINPSANVFGGASTAGTWEGFYFDTVNFDFSNSTTFTMLVNGGAEGVVKLKLEDKTNGNVTISVDVDYTEVDDWQLMSFTYDGVDPIYDRATIFFDFGSETAGNMWYFDQFIGPEGYEGNAVESIDRQNRVYPNPFLNKLNIKSTTALTEVDIFNIMGQNVLTENGLNALSVDLETSQLRNGIYFMKTKDVNGRISTSKLIKN